MKWQKRLNIALTVALTIAFILFGVFVFGVAYQRVFEALIDLYGGFKYYLCVLFGLPTNDLPSVTDYSKVMEWTVILPSDFEGFKVNTMAYFSMLFSKENFLSWLSVTGAKVSVWAKVLTIFLPCVVVLIIVVKRIYATPNTRHNKDTFPLRIYKVVTRYTIEPLKRFLRQYFEFVKQHNSIWIIWLIIWVFNLNFATVITEFFAFYFYFAVSFDFKAIYTQIVKLFIDLQVIVKHVPIWIILIFVWLIFERWRKNLATAKLRRMENANRGFINDLPIVSMTCGSMGKKKTTIITDMALSQEVMFRNIAYGKLQETDMKFPNFGWIAFEMELRKCMEYGTVYNLATVKEWIKVKRARYEKHHNDLLQLYGYDSERYGLYYRDGLKTSYIFDVLSTYAQLYFIYVIQSSLIVANYSIREDNRLIDGGNFPIWSTDFFSKNPRPSRHAHILDFDILRLGKKVLENNPNAGSFEFGVVAITEVGKERGNNLELKEVKKGTEETNQKNDLFNSWLKMCRHSATVDNYPFIKVFTDEQRPSSWGADARELCDIVHIVSSGNTRLALPFFTIEDMLNEWLFNRFINLYEDFRFNRGDNTLLIYLLKKVTAFVYRRNTVIYNTYGYSISNIEKERGTMDGKTEKKKYYLMNKKIYSQRFSTDCFSDYFNELAKGTHIGMNDYTEYATEKASVQELKRQNSYFINSLYTSNEKDEN
ncbi:MAG: hypothetical protein ACLTAN_02610 [Christensenellaceae bacterium]